MESSIAGEICVFRQICNNAQRSPSTTSGNNFNMEINIVAKHVYTCGDKFVEECHFGIRTTEGYKYKSLSWDIVDKELSAFDFPFPLEKVKWDGVDKILESRDDLIQQILEFARMTEDVTPPFKDDDTVYVSLKFVKHVYVSPQEFELTQAKIVAEHYERTAEILRGRVSDRINWAKVRDEINGLGHRSSLYEEFQSLKGYVKEILRESICWRTCFDENRERVLVESLIEQVRMEFMLLPAVRSRMQFIRRVQLSENELIDECSICMGSYLPEQEAYNMPCNHSFHLGCIETWLLKNPSCPMCRYKLPPTYSK